MFPSVGSNLVDVRPCPAPSSPLVALLTPQSIGIIDVETMQPVASFPASSMGSPSAACWSVKGKQIAVGFANGFVAQFTPEGEKKAEVGPPPALTSSGSTYLVRSLEWLENNVFLVTYAKPRDPASGEPTHEDEVYIIERSSSSMNYVHFMDPSPAFGMMSREGRRWFAKFKSW